MPLRFTVLGSGSAGNASLVEANGFGLLLDVGLGPRQLGTRLTTVGASWSNVHAVLLTHTHSDHWNERTFAHLRRRRIPIYCHAAHHAVLLNYGGEFAKLQADRLVRTYESKAELELASGLRCRPLTLRHDGGATFGFRFDLAAVDAEPLWALAYVADLGSWTTELAEEMAEVDVLAIEFNHDVALERASGRSPALIARVLGDEGHLSNAQAAALLEEVLRLSTPGRLRHVVQLHLSRECNRTGLAREAAHAVLDGHPIQIALHTAVQDRAGPRLALGSEANGKKATMPPAERVKVARPPRRKPTEQAWFPGWEE
jgi:phosphoribosyl 1,2-cyclic phosphodiesterase